MKTFQIELIITNDCNLSCPYCYVNQNKGSLTIQTLKKALPKIHYYMKKANCTDYFISFFGGEPLIKFNLIKDIYSLLIKDEYFKGCNLISNLCLINEQIRDFLLEKKIYVSWSFDGLTSNISRKTKSKKDILSIYNEKRNLILSLTNGCKAMVYPDNVKDMLTNVKYLHKDFGLQAIDLSLVRDNIWTKNDINEFKKQLPSLYEYYKQNNIQRGFFNLLKEDYKIAKKFGKRDFGCFAGVNGCCVTTDGQIFACERFATENKFNYEKMEDPYKFKSTYNPKNYKKCKNCELYEFCNCGCLYSQFLNNNQPLDCVCELYKAIYEIIKSDL